MTDEEKIKSVTAKLTGEFYVGQRVRGVWNEDRSAPIGVVTCVHHGVQVDWYNGDRSAGPVYTYLPGQLKPL